MEAARNLQLTVTLDPDAPEGLDGPWDAKQLRSALLEAMHASECLPTDFVEDLDPDGDGEASVVASKALPASAHASGLLLHLVQG